MAKKEKAIYAPGELARLRDKLGVSDPQEANRLAAVLGGEVGVERNEETPVKMPVKRTSSAAVLDRNGSSDRRVPQRRVDLAPDEDESEAPKESPARRPVDPDDDPLVPVKASYMERIKMDRFCALPEFKIKSSTQVFMTMLAFFGEPPDMVNPVFVDKIIDTYYKKLERLVTSVRAVFPRNNAKRNDKLKRLSPFSYNVLNTLRYWNLEKIASDMAKIQAHPRSVTVSEFSGILKAVYRPLFVLEGLEINEHIKAAFRMLYKILYVEDPKDAKDRIQSLIHEAMIALANVRQEVHYCLYPLLMKILSNKFIPYESFFSARRNRFLRFIEAEDSDQLDPAAMKAEFHAAKAHAAGGEEKRGNSKDKEDPNDPEAVKNRTAATHRKERKAMLQGIASLEALFPKAGWDQLSKFPDMFPYFQNIYKFKRNYELISPQDPLLQTVVIIRILEDIFLGFRNIRFGKAVLGESGPIHVDESINGTLNIWQDHRDFTIEKEYLPRLGEYCRMLEQSGESRSSNYAKRLFCELHWIKRIFFFPYHKFNTDFPSPFPKNENEPLYSSVRSLRRGLTLVAAGIEQANLRGGAEKMAPCDGIDNPWESYDFAIPNPVSTRLNALLPPRRRNNATLVFFSLAFSTVLDHLVNDENSWAYYDNDVIPFRNLHGVPQVDMTGGIDADAVFAESLRQRGGSAKSPPSGETKEGAGKSGPDLPKSPAAKASG